MLKPGLWEEVLRLCLQKQEARCLRSFILKKDHLDEHGYTRGCGGCSSVFRGLARQPHNDMCRERLRGILKEGAKVRNAEGRKHDF